MKWRAFSCLLVFAFALTSCSSREDSKDGTESNISSSVEDSGDGLTGESSEQNAFEASGVSSYDYFGGYFSDYFTQEEFVNLCTMASEYSATPKIAINHSLFIAKQTFATYNSSETNYVIMDTEGNIIRDYGDNGFVIDDFIKMGKFSFVCILGNPETFEILDEKGNLLNVWEVYSGNPRVIHLYDLGNDYHMFTSFTGGEECVSYLLTPSGEFYKITFPHTGIPSAWTIEPDIAEGKLQIGSISEGKFYVLYAPYSVSYPLSCVGWAYYFDTFGEVVIDLSSEKTNYYIYEMNDFVDGVAEIHFKGTDGVKYTAMVDTTGTIIGEPTQIVSK